MKKVKRTEKYIKDVYADKLQVTASSNLDKRVLANSMSKLEKIKNGNLVNARPNIWRVVAKSKITQIAAAAVIIIATSLFFMQPEKPEEVKTQQITQMAKSPAELTTFASLSFAYRQGGMERVEQICDEALKMAGPRPASVSMQEFFEEINNGSSERKEL